MRLKKLVPAILGIALALTAYLVLEKRELLTGIFASSSSDKSSIGPSDGPRVIVLRSSDEDFAPFGESALSGARAAAIALATRSGQASPRYRVDEYRFQGEEPEELTEELKTRLPLPEVALLLIADDDSRTRAAIQAADSLRIPIFYLSDGPCKTFIEEAGPSPYVWGAGFAWETLLEPLFISANDRLAPPEQDLSVIFVGVDSPESRSFTATARNSAEDLGFKILDERFTDPRITDFYTFIRDIFASAPNVLFIHNPTTSGKLFIQQAGKLSVAKEMTMMGVDSFDAELLPSLGVSADAAITVGRYSPQINSKENEEFLTAYKKVTPEAKPTAADGRPQTLASPQPSETALGAYAGVLLLDAARSKHAAKPHTPTTASAAKNPSPKGGPQDSQASLLATNAAEPEREITQWIRSLPDLEILGPVGRVYADPDNHVLHQPLFVLKVDHGTLKVVDSLGEASHPRKEGCYRSEPTAPPAKEDVQPEFGL